MSKEKILRNYNYSIHYTEEIWALLKSKRKRAIEILAMFKGLIPYVYGSIARGNIHEDSDIDVIFINQIPTFQIEMILNKNGYENYLREIIMATPKDSIRLYIHLNELECVTVPLTKLNKKTLEFYDFGGKINLDQLKKDIRVPGIDKRLVLIKPTSQGHEEISVIENEHIAAKEVGISINIINERKRVLLRREKHGRTGVFLKRQLRKDETTEEVLKELSNKKSIVRKKLFQR
ncbi:MAG: nucleotidyltransferase domain-containing protein [Promethearchaeota archaeon]